MLSRAAENLYWMARYVERAENAARILDSTYRMSLVPHENDADDSEWFAPLNITGTVYPFTGRYSRVTAKDVMYYIALDPNNPGSIYSCARQARENARGVRGAITIEMWEVINTTWLEIQQMGEERLNGEGVTVFFDWVKDRSHMFRGVTVGTALKDEAFHFNRLGTFLERADNTARILDVKYHILLPSLQEVGGVIDYYQWAAVLRSVSAFQSYRNVYRDAINPLKVAELLILRQDMPRSLHACLEEVFALLQMLPTGASHEALRIAGELHAQLRFGRIDAIFAGGLHEYLTGFLSRLNGLSNEVNRSYFSAAYA
jgi:uncharacterized alpha-E superfamily protein